MRAPSKIRGVIVALLLVLSAEAGAAGKCSLGQTIQQCWNLYLPEKAVTVVTPGANPEVAAKEKEATSGQQEALKAKETGLDGGAPALATTTSNLLPFLAASGLISDSDGNGEDGLLTLDLNFLIKGLAKDNNAKLQAVLNTQPALFEDLKSEFDDVTGSTDRSKALQDDLSASDDYTISFTYSHINDRFGRAFKQYQRRFSNLFEAAITVANNSRANDSSALFALAGFLEANSTDEKPMDQDTVIADPRLLALVETAAANEQNLEAEVRRVISANHLSTFVDLVNNQPQLLFSAEVHKRDELVGPSEKSVKFTYEFGLANVNDFDDENGNICDLLDSASATIDLAAAQSCLNAFSSYAGKNEASLKHADRFSVELAYSEVDDYDYASVADGVSLARDGTHHLDLSVGYGRTFQTIGADRDSRFDFVLKYEDYSDDVDHKDRMVATATFTTKLNGFSIPLSLVYANHEKFLPESDEQLSAHIGFKYELDQKE